MVGCGDVVFGKTTCSAESGKKWTTAWVPLFPLTSSIKLQFLIPPAEPLTCSAAAGQMHVRFLPLIYPLSFSLSSSRRRLSMPRCFGMPSVCSSGADRSLNLFLENYTRPSVRPCLAGVCLCPKGLTALIPLYEFRPFLVASQRWLVATTTVDGRQTDPKATKYFFLSLNGMTLKRRRRRWHRVRTSSPNPWGKWQTSSRWKGVGMRTV